jgi:hypothetical protein
MIETTLELVQNLSTLSGSELSRAVERVTDFLNNRSVPSQAKEPIVKALVEGRHQGMGVISAAFIDLLPDPFLGTAVAGGIWESGALNVMYAIRCLRDEYLYPARMSRGDAERAVKILKDAAPSMTQKDEFDQWYQKNWVAR